MKTKRIFWCLTAIIFTTICVGQTQKPTINSSGDSLILVDGDSKAGSDPIYNSVEVQPEFPGGIRAFMRYVQKNMTLPMAPVNGSVIVTFIVEKDGGLSEIKVIRDLGFGTKEAAEKVLRDSPKWKPGVQNGKPVRVRFSLPIKIDTRK